MRSRRDCVRDVHFGVRQLPDFDLSGKFGADVAAEGAALYMYTRKPDNAADAPKSPEKIERNARRMTSPTKPKKSEEFYLTPSHWDNG